MAVYSLAPRPHGGAKQEDIVPGFVLGTRADLTVRLADGAADVDAAQHLRYRVFYEELEARPDAQALATRRDADRYDAICDHLLVVRKGAALGPDEIRVNDGEVVGTYRLLRQSVAERTGGFYTQDEFDIAPLIQRHGGLKFLELGRSCVLKSYRTKPVVELLWQGIWNYVRLYDLDVMLGCASIEGTDPAPHAMALSFMAQNSAAPPEWRVAALPGRRVEMNLLPSAEVDAKRALRILPPLIKGYLRLGCYIGDGAVIDHQFNTIDVLIILPVSAINPRYFSYFGQPGEDPLAQL
ncbi:MAG: GNAT family N-acetyltransferase [Parvibaculaceae bacterium]